MIDCSGNTPFITQTWCTNIFGYTQSTLGQHAKEDDYVSVSAPAQPPGALPPGIEMSIVAGRPVRTGTQVQVPLTIRNTGAQRITALNLTDISLRTFAGVGEATLAQTTLPISIGELEGGANTTITLTLNVSMGVTKLQLTENGVAESSGSAPYRFSLGQVVYPNYQP
jgi:hypothetical protein